MSNLKINANGDAVAMTEVNGSSVMIPVDIQSRLQKTIQTHNAVSVATNTESVPATWIDCDGCGKISVTLLNSAAVSSSLMLYWSNDGTNVHGKERLMPSASDQYREPVTTEIGARFVKVVPKNEDTASQTMSAWIFLTA